MNGSIGTETDSSNPDKSEQSFYSLGDFW